VNAGSLAKVELPGVLLSCALVLSGPLHAQPAPSCDRACLEGFVDRYLEALVAHDPSRAPFAANVKVTENGQNLGIGQGLWKTASKGSSYRLYFADPVPGQVGFIGVIEENEQPAIIALRLKVQDGQITEAETIVSRVQAGGFARVENFVEPYPVLVEALTPRVAAVARIGRMRWATGAVDNPDTLVPLYLRAPAIGPQN